MARWDVFISYSRKDAAVVDEYVHRLNGAGLGIWLDRNPRPGGPTLLPLKLSHGLAESSILVLFLSDNAVSSSWVCQEVAAFSKKAWGLWDDGVEPNILVVRFPGTDFDLDRLLHHPWRYFPNKPVGVYVLEAADHGSAAGEVVDFVRKAVPVLREHTQTYLAGFDPFMAAARYWKWTLPNLLQDWDIDQLPALLNTFHDYEPPPAANCRETDHRLEQAISEVIEVGATGTSLAVLFAEAVASAEGGRYASLDDRTDPELSAVVSKICRGPQSLQVISSGSPVDLLGSVAVDRNIASGLRDAYRMLRPTLTDARSRDALDLTALLGLGYCLSRWVWKGVGPAEAQAELLNGSGGEE